VEPDVPAPRPGTRVSLVRDRAPALPAQDGGRVRAAGLGRERRGRTASRVLGGCARQRAQEHLGKKVVCVGGAPAGEEADRPARTGV
jgi:hypothetical protein